MHGPKWSNRDTLEKEKEVIGFYLSAHPLDTYRQHINWFKPQSFTAIREAAQNHRGQQEFNALMCGLLKSRKDIVTKKGDRMAFIQLEDGHEAIEIVLFPKTFAQVESWLSDFHVFLVSGAVDSTDPKTLKIKAHKLVPLELVLQEWHPIAHAILELPQTVDQQALSLISKTLIEGKIAASIVFHDQGKKLRLALKQTIALDSDIMANLEKLGISVHVGVQ